MEDVGDPLGHGGSGKGDWPTTPESLYGSLVAGGRETQAELTRHLMRLYFDSILFFYIKVARTGDRDFPRVVQLRSKEVQAGSNAELLEERAHEVVQDYFASRAGVVIREWLSFRVRARSSRARRLRSFLRQDFRYHCKNLMRKEVRNRSAELFLGDYELDLDMDLSSSIRREMAKRELTALLDLAIEQAVWRYRSSSVKADDLMLLIEHRILRGEPYRNFAERLSCSLVAARQHVCRFRAVLQLSLRDLLQEQGTDPDEYLEELR
jgi:hypothetical protein